MWKRVEKNRQTERQWWTMCKQTTWKIYAMFYGERWENRRDVSDYELKKKSVKLAHALKSLY